MASQPETGAADGQPGDRLPVPCRGVSRSLEILTSALVAEHERASQPFLAPADGTYRFRPGDQQLPVPNDGPSMHDVGKVIRSHREAARVSRREFALRLGVAESTLQRWELGRRIPDSSRLTDIAAVLGFGTVESFLGAEPQQQAPQLETERTCNRCREVKPIGQFEPAKRYRNGRMPVCRACRKEYRNELASRPKAAPGASKKCFGCEIEQPIGEFHQAKNSADGRDYRCRTCKSAASPPDPYGNWVRMLRWKFGIAPEDYERMLVAQGGVCAICEQPPNRQRVRLDIDHDHQTGEIRGLLCSECNRAIGLLRDRPIVAAKAARYLLGDNAVVARGEFRIEPLSEADLAELYEFMLDSAVYARRLIFESEARAMAKQAIDELREFGYVPKRDIPGVTS